MIIISDQQILSITSTSITSGEYLPGEHDYTCPFSFIESHCKVAPERGVLLSERGWLDGRLVQGFSVVTSRCRKGSGKTQFYASTDNPVYAPGEIFTNRNNSSFARGCYSEHK